MQRVPVPLAEAGALADVTDAARADFGVPRSSSALYGVIFFNKS